MSVKSCSFICLIVVLGIPSLLVTARRCTDIPFPCGANQFCLNETDGVNVLCVGCSSACKGCVGPNNDNCKSCAHGYRRTGAICQACSPQQFGENCTGTCHCLNQVPCRKTDGFCVPGWKCAHGWKEPPLCQQQCDNDTFGLDCRFVCHCPEGVSCDKVNGACASRGCHPDYAGPGCQILLPKLVNPPEARSVECGRANITWPVWAQDVDIGEGPIAEYRLFRERNDTGVWELVSRQVVVVNRTEYFMYMTDLQGDQDYRFRVDVHRQDGDKVMPSAALGFKSIPVFIPCLVTTETPLTTTTQRSIIGLKVFDFVVPNLYPNGTITVTWRLTRNATNVGTTFNITMTYQEVGIGDCAVIRGPINTVVLPQGATGAFNLDTLVPWRVYSIILEAFSDEFNITDILERRIASRETAPTGSVGSVVTTNLESRSVTITWADVTCEERGGTYVQYVLSLTSVSGTVGSTANETSYDYTGLLPFTQHTVRIQYENTQGIGPMSTPFQFTTREEAPGPMTITGVEPRAESILISFTSPVPTNGILTEYGVTYNDNTTASKTLTFPATGSQVTIDSLRAFTVYYFKMRARTSAGWGPYTTETDTTTLEDFPSPPTALTLTSSNETCLTVSWQQPVLTNGPLLTFNISYQMTPEGSTKSTVVPSTVTQFTDCSLQPWSLYLVSVKAVNGRGSSNEVSGSIHTVHGNPVPPPAPIFVNATYTSILIEIEPVILESGPVSKYQLRVAKVASRKKRQTNLPGVATADLSKSDVHQRRFFTIGDGGTYGGVQNEPLERETKYDIYYVVFSTGNGLTKVAYSKVKTSVLTVPPVIQTTTPVPETGSNVGLIIGIIVGIILLILLILLLLLFLWWRRRNSSPPYKPHTDANSYDLPEVKNDYDPEKYWNTVYSTRESRYIVAGREYLPDDQITMNGEAIVNPTSPRVTFKDEFKSLPHTFKDPCIAAKERRNEQKNRFPHLLPYDKSRVILHPDDDTACDYINASYVSGYKRPQAYIAAQSPFDEDTVLDFWRLISQKQLKTVVMITNIVEDNIVKCTQYWPDDGRASYGTFLLELLDIEIYASYTIRVVAYQSSNGVKGSVRIFEFTSWPDHGVPFDPIPLLDMRKRVRQVHKNERGPILVHCGTGMGRTGAFIAIDSLVEQYKYEGRTSVYAFVKKMRRDRPFMVRTYKEYVFIYETLFEEFHAGMTCLGMNLKEFYHDLTTRNRKTGHSFLKGQFRLLENYTRRPRPDQCHTALLPPNYNKNRYPDVIPLENYRPLLQTPGGAGAGRTDYINAIALDGFRVQNQYLLTQTPLHTTIVDFWKLVYDYDVNTIVMMEAFKHEDDTCAEYWPDVNMKPYEPFLVETTATYQEDNVTIRNFKISNTHKPDEAPKFVRQFQFNGWDEPNVVPTSKTLILDLMALVSDWQYKTNDNTRPIVVHCRDGATHSGLFCALSVICDTFEADEEVDLFHTVKHMKRRRAQIVAYPEQLRFCYKTLWDFINLRLLPEGGFSDTFDKVGVQSLSLTSFYDTLHSN